MYETVYECVPSELLYNMFFFLSISPIKSCRKQLLFDLNTDADVAAAAAAAARCSVWRLTDHNLRAPGERICCVYKYVHFLCAIAFAGTEQSLQSCYTCVAYDWPGARNVLAGVAGSGVPVRLAIIVLRTIGEWGHALPVLLDRLYRLD